MDMNLVDWSIREEMAKTIDDLDLRAGETVMLPWRTIYVTNSFGFTLPTLDGEPPQDRDDLVAVILTEKGETCLKEEN